MKAKLLIIIILTCFIGCATQTSTIKTPEGKIYTFEGQKEERVKLKIDESMEIEFDRSQSDKSDSGFLDSFFQVLTLGLITK